jgi:hypothetical protein
MPEGLINLGGNLKKEWIVWPFTFNAAMPVGARTTTFFFVVFLNNCKRVDLPVPARPVIKKCSFPDSIL